MSVDHESPIIDEGTISRGYGVFLGANALKDGPIEVYPLMEFLNKLSLGEVIG